jgi:tRNA dimethylallyltransferase
VLYWRALAAGLSALPAAQPQVRARLAERQAAEGSSAMHAWLAEVDPVTADRVHQNDPQRIQRALEVFLVTGRPMSGLLRRESGTALPYRVLKLVRSPRERSILHRRIEVRLQAMLDAGFEDEVRALHERADLNANLPSMRAVGYRQLWAYLSGEIGFEQMRERALAATRQLAKRQYTWLRAEQKALWLWDGPGVEQAALQQVEAFLDAGEPASHIDDRPCFR